MDHHDTAMQDGGFCGSCMFGDAAEAAHLMYLSQFLMLPPSDQREKLEHVDRHSNPTHKPTINRPLVGHVDTAPDQVLKLLASELTPPAATQLHHHQLASHQQEYHHQNQDLQQQHYLSHHDHHHQPDQQIQHDQQAQADLEQQQQQQQPPPPPPQLQEHHEQLPPLLHLHPEQQQEKEAPEQKHQPLQQQLQREREQSQLLLLQQTHDNLHQQQQQKQQQQQLQELILLQQHHQQQLFQRHQQEQEAYQNRQKQQQQQLQKIQEDKREQKYPLQQQQHVQLPQQQLVSDISGSRKQRKKRSSNTIFLRDIVKQPSGLCSTSAQLLITGESTSAGPSSVALSSSLVSYNLHTNSRTLPVLENILSTINVGCRLDLRVIAQRALNADYNPEFFSGLVMRLKEPRATALMFSSGRIVVTGTRSEELSRLAARKFARILQRIGFQARFEEFRVRNVVASCSVGFELNIEGIFLTHNNFCTYEPDLFPGLIYQMFHSPIILLIFSSGKVVLTGSKDWSDICAAFKSIYPVLQGFRLS